MIIDSLNYADRYHLNAGITIAFNYLQATDLKNIAPGKYEIDDENIFAIVHEYETLNAANEQMEAHKKYIDVQYMIHGAELVGHAVLKDHTISKPYSETEDYMLFSDPPLFFSKLEAGMFMIFFPTDMHMPCVKIKTPSTVKKIVIKVKV